MATLDQEDVEAIVRGMRAAACDRECAVESIPTHAKQHEVLERWIANDARRQERAEKIKTQVIGWSIVTFLGGVGTGVYHAFQYLREHLR